MIDSEFQYTLNLQTNLKVAPDTDKGFLNETFLYFIGYDTLYAFNLFCSGYRRL